MLSLVLWLFNTENRPEKKRSNRLSELHQQWRKADADERSTRKTPLPATVAA
jgi:hypothetical protein